MKTRKIKFIANVVRWFDQINGNTYHSVRITRVSDGAVISRGMTYGYGSAYEQTALELMSDHKWLPVKYRGENAFNYNRENNYTILFEVIDGLKRDMVNNAKTGE